jgi:ketosteroid isomerase-like protein
MNARRLAALVAVSLAACTPALIPGTGAEDTAPNREVFGVIRSYAEAMQKRDAAAVLALVAPDFYDNAGTPSPDDDLDRAALEQVLAADLAKVESLKLELSVRKIEVRPNGVEAIADLVYDNYFRVLTPTGPVPKRESDLHRMWFRKIDGSWKIMAGI